MLLLEKVSSPRGFEWLSQMRFYFDPKKSDVLQQLSIHMANAQFNYGFEYLGVQDKLVQTPLTDRLYLTMTQALEERLGGSPFGQCIVVLLLFQFVVYKCLKELEIWFSYVVLVHVWWFMHLWQFWIEIKYSCHVHVFRVHHGV